MSQIYEIVVFKPDGTTEKIQPAEFSLVTIAVEGVYYTPFYGTSNRPHTIFIPHSRIETISIVDFEHETKPGRDLYRGGE